MRRQAFTLLEMVIVILILGILATIAIPRYLQHSRVTTDQALRIQLLRVRDAIDRYQVEHDRELPPSDRASSFRNALARYLRNGFPPVTVGPAANASAQALDVRISDTSASISGDPSPTQGWHYNRQTGQFIINWNESTAVEPAQSYDQL